MTPNGTIRYPHPFRGWHGHGVEHPKTVFELKMWALSNAIREKPCWWEKVNDNAIMGKWKQEALDQQKDLPKARALSEKMIDYTLAELFVHARVRKKNGGIELGPYDRIWKSDTLIPEELRQDLLSAVAPLENVPDPQKDWNPETDRKVLDLVNPSLYPVVYGKTHTLSYKGENSLRLAEAPGGKTRDYYFISQKFQWLASDFFVSEDGMVQLDSPYINNINPITDAKLYKVIPKVIECAVPMLEHVLSDLRRKLSPSRLEHDEGRCIWGAGGASDRPARPGHMDLLSYYKPGYDPDEDSSTDEDGESHYQKAKNKYWFDQTMYLPDAREEYDSWLDDIKRTAYLRGARIQVIIKLFNIVLTPEKPKYHGGIWRVEGMGNEGIIANFIYCYESENISESRLDFKLVVSGPNTHGHGDEFCTKALYGIGRGGPLAQEIGGILVNGGRCIAFPNLYQHQFKPFNLEDPTKPGVQKMIAVFLCDPHIERISTSRVSPQQKEWIRGAMCNPAEGSLFRKLPRELLDMIVENVDGLVSRKEANKFREDLMRERGLFLNQHAAEFFGVEFNTGDH